MKTNGAGKKDKKLDMKLTSHKSTDWRVDSISHQDKIALQFIALAFAICRLRRHTNA